MSDPTPHRPTVDAEVTGPVARPSAAGPRVPMLHAESTRLGGYQPLPDLLADLDDLDEDAEGATEPVESAVSAPPAPPAPAAPAAPPAPAAGEPPVDSVFGAGGVKPEHFDSPAPESPVLGKRRKHRAPATSKGMLTSGRVRIGVGVLLVVALAAAVFTFLNRDPNPTPDPEPSGAPEAVVSEDTKTRVDNAIVETLIAATRLDQIQYADRERRLTIITRTQTNITTAQESLGAADLTSTPDGEESLAAAEKALAGLAEVVETQHACLKRKDEECAITSSQVTAARAAGESVGALRGFSTISDGDLSELVEIIQKQAVAEGSKGSETTVEVSTDADTDHT